MSLYRYISDDILVIMDITDIKQNKFNCVKNDRNPKSKKPSRIMMS